MKKIDYPGEFVSQSYAVNQKIESITIISGQGAKEIKVGEDNVDNIVEVVSGNNDNIYNVFNKNGEILYQIKNCPVVVKFFDKE